MWFGSWHDLGRLLVVGPVAYAVLVAVLRLTDTRTLSKLNAFDLVITVAVGSTLAPSFLSSEVTAAEGALGLILLVLLQYVVTWTSVRSPRVASMVRSEPSLIYRDGLLEAAPCRERVTENEVRQVARRKLQCPHPRSAIRTRFARRPAVTPRRDRPSLTLRPRTTDQGVRTRSTR
jgi:uncharacterized membrane protein YcaP (DUF421 family)